MRAPKLSDFCRWHFDLQSDDVVQFYMDAEGVLAYQSSLRRRQVEEEKKLELAKEEGGDENMAQQKSYSPFTTAFLQVQQEKTRY